MEQSIKQKISCEQIYNIWTTEPEIIVLVDLRSAESFRAGHIPGSQRLDESKLYKFLRGLEDKLAVLICEPEQEQTINQDCRGLVNYVFLNQCRRWKELELPLSGDGFAKTQQRFDQILSTGEHVNQNIIFHQLFEPQSSTYTYIVADRRSKEAAIIDPVLETVDRDIKLIEELGLKLIYALDTHVHADHITGAWELKKRLGVKTAVSADSGVSCVDIPLEDGQELLLGDKTLKIIATPGHTNTCVTYAFEGMIFTGDALLIRSCGRTDFQQGDAEKLYQSVHEKLYRLPEDTLVYPGHDYRGQTSSTIGAEKKFNARISQGTTLQEFRKVMSEINLDQPKRIHEAVPANLQCGRIVGSRVLHPQIVDGIPEMTVEDLFLHMQDVKNKKVRLIDVRRPDEYNNELGHVEGAELISLGAELTQFLQQGNRDEEIVFICRSGGRSGTATAESIRLGYKFTINMVGGMLRWNEKQLPVVRV